MVCYTKLNRLHDRSISDKRGDLFEDPAVRV